MNNLNFLGSSLFVINLDFNYQFSNDFQENKNYPLNINIKGNYFNNSNDNVKKLVLPQIKII